MGPYTRELFRRRRHHIQDNCLYKGWAYTRELLRKWGPIYKIIVYTKGEPNTQENCLYKWGQYTRELLRKWGPDTR
jgi:hypothetical protein